MASYSFKDCKTYLGGYDLSGSLNQASLSYECETLDATTFGQTTRINQGGLLVAKAAVAGFWDAATTSAPDPAIQALIGTADLPCSMIPQGATIGNTAYLFRTLGAKYTLGAPIGDLLKYDVELPGSGGNPGLVRGNLLWSGSATGNQSGTTAVQAGAIASGKSLYAALHVFSGDGDFTVKIQSDDNSGFTSATDRVTFTQVGTATAVSTEWKTLAGAVTDTYWRIVSTNPNTRVFAVTIGIK